MVMEQECSSNVASKVTFVGLIVNTLLTIGKLIVGFLFNSMALIADGFHSFSDLASDIFILIAFQFSKKPADKDHNYGHGKIDVMSEMIVSLLLFVVAKEMIKAGANALANIQTKPLSEPSMIVIAMAFVSIVTKEWMYQYTMHYGKKIDSGVLCANAIHHRTDALSSVAVVVALGFAKVLGGKWLILDPIIAIVVAIYIIKIGLEIFAKSFYNLIDGAVSDAEYQKIMKIIDNTKEVSDPHNVRTRKVGKELAIEFHIRVNPDMSVRQAHEKATMIEEELKQEFGYGTFVNIHIEPTKVNGEYK